MIVLDGLDAAIIGYTISEPTQVIYDHEKVIETLIETFNELPEDERYDAAVEWYTFNIERSLDYMGQERPLIMMPADRKGVDEYADSLEE